MNGIAENRFAPNENITRGMVMTILYRMASSPEVTGGSPYTDVAENRYFSQAVASRQSKGLQRAIPRWYLPTKSAGHPAGASDLLLAVTITAAI